MIPDWPLSLKLWRDRRGAFAVPMAIMAPLLFAAMGASLDFGQLVLVKTRVQWLIDQQLRSYMTDNSIALGDLLLLTRRAQAVLDAELPGSASATLGLTTGPNSMTITVYLDLNTSFLKSVGIDELTATVISTATPLNKSQQPVTAPRLIR